MRNQFALAAVAAIGLSVPSWGQQANIRSVLTVRLKPDRVGDFQAAIRQYNEELKKIKWSRRVTVWSSMSGQNQYKVVRTLTKWGDMDASSPASSNPELAALTARIRSCEESARTEVEEVMPDLSLSSSGLAEIPKVIRVSMSRIRPDKIAEYEALVKNEVLPGYRKAGAKSFSVARMRYGADSNTFVVVLGLNGWADLDGQSPIQRAMGQEAYHRMADKLASLWLERQVDLYRFHPELSYLPGTGVSATETAVRQ